jgi:hypothetical protein
MRCKRKTGGLAVTPHENRSFMLCVTKILQLRRNLEIPKRKLLVRLNFK